MADGIPQGLSEYHPAPVAPGWPNLPDQGIPLVNAAATAASLANARDAVKGKLAQYALKMQEMEGKAALDEKKFEMAQEHNAFMERYNLKRQSDLEASLNDSHQRLWEETNIHEREARNRDQKAALFQQNVQRINDYEARMMALRADPNIKIGTPEFQMAMNSINTEFSDINSSGRGLAVSKDNEAQQKGAMESAQKALKRSADDIKTNIGLSTGWNRYAKEADFMEGDDAWFHDPKMPEGQVTLAKDPATGRVLTKAEKEAIYEKAKKTNDYKDYNSIKWITTSEENRKVLEEMARKHMQEKPPGFSLRSMPGTGTQVARAKMILPDPRGSGQEHFVMVDQDQVQNWVDQGGRLA